MALAFLRWGCMESNSRAGGPVPPPPAFAGPRQASRRAGRLLNSLRNHARRTRMADNDAPAPARAAEQIIRAGLLRALARAPEADISPATWLDKIIQAHLDKAAGGDLAAIR